MTKSDRRRLLQIMGVAAVAPTTLIACNVGGTTNQTTVISTSNVSTASASAATTTASNLDGSCSAIPSEVAGPYPADGSDINGVNALALSGIVRSNIKGSLTTSGVAAGVPLTINLKLVSQSCTSLAGYAVYLWHADRDGNYSLYSPSIVNENYLRGVQVADADGNLTFTTIFPGCEAGRYPHVHIEVFQALADATKGSNNIKTSQFTFTSTVFAAIYASAGYTTSATNLAATNLVTDSVFSDGASLQTANTSGSLSSGYSAALQIGI